MGGNETVSKAVVGEEEIIHEGEVIENEPPSVLLEIFNNMKKIDKLGIHSVFISFEPTTGQLYTATTSQAQTFVNNSDVAEKFVNLFTTLKTSAQQSVDVIKLNFSKLEPVLVKNADDEADDDDAYDGDDKVISARNEHDMCSGDDDDVNYYNNNNNNDNADEDGNGNHKNVVDGMSSTNNHGDNNNNNSDDDDDDDGDDSARQNDDEEEEENDEDDEDDDDVSFNSTDCKNYLKIKRKCLDKNYIDNKISNKTNRRDNNFNRNRNRENNYNNNNDDDGDGKTVSDLIASIIKNKFKIFPALSNPAGPQKVRKYKKRTKNDLVTCTEYKCTVCDKVLRYKSTLKEHMKLHTGFDKKFACDQCNSRFRHISKLKQHMSVHSSEHPHICPTCQRGYKSLLSLQHHMETHSDKCLSCHICGALFSREKYLTRHLMVHEGKKNLCQICGKAYLYISELKRHLLVCHSGHQNIQEACEDVAAASHSPVNSGRGRDHSAATTATTTTTTTTTSYTTDTIITSSSSSNTANTTPAATTTCSKNDSAVKFGNIGGPGESVRLFKQYRCEICNKQLQNKPALICHMSTHSDSKDYCCDLCGACFKSKSNLYIHSKRIHESFKPYACEHCGQAFLYPHLLRSHYRVREKNGRCHRERARHGEYVCNVCGVVFSTAASLWGHSSRHVSREEEKKFRCNDCGKEFAKQRSLRRHCRIFGHGRSDATVTSAVACVDGSSGGGRAGGKKIELPGGVCEGADLVAGFDGSKKSNSGAGGDGGRQNYDDEMMVKKKMVVKTSSKTIDGGGGRGSDVAGVVIMKGDLHDGDGDEYNDDVPRGGGGSGVKGKTDGYNIDNKEDDDDDEVDVAMFCDNDNSEDDKNDEEDDEEDGDNEVERMVLRMGR